MPGTFFCTCASKSADTRGIRRNKKTTPQGWVSAFWIVGTWTISLCFPQDRCFTLFWMLEILFKKNQQGVILYLKYKFYPKSFCSKSGTNPRAQIFSWVIKIEGAIDRGCSLEEYPFYYHSHHFCTKHLAGWLFVSVWLQKSRLYPERSNLYF